MGALLGCRTGKDRDVAAAVLVLPLDAPVARGVAVLEQPDVGVKFVVDGGIAVMLIAIKPRALGRVHGVDNLSESPGTICHGAYRCQLYT